MAGALDTSSLKRYCMGMEMNRHHDHNDNPNGCTWCLGEGRSLVNLEADAKLARLRARAEARRAG